MHGLFLVEGSKSVTEFVNSAYQVEAIYHTPTYAPKLLNLSHKINLFQVSDDDLAKISTLTTPQQTIALVKIPFWPVLTPADLQNKFTLVLDGLQDPGNLGTIIRTADWFNIANIICSDDCVDAYNPKTVQAAMGSLPRVKLHYVNIGSVLAQTQLPVYGALLNGQSIYQTNFGTEGLIVMGNEGNGIRPQTQALVSQAVTIPRLGQAESLNVAIATAIFCSEIGRKTLK